MYVGVNDVCVTGVILTYFKSVYMRSARPTTFRYVMCKLYELSQKINSGCESFKRSRSWRKYRRQRKIRYYVTKMLIILCGSKICIYIQNRDRLNLINAVKNIFIWFEFVPLDFDIYLWQTEIFSRSYCGFKEKFKGCIVFFRLNQYKSFQSINLFDKTLFFSPIRNWHG